MKVNLSLDLTDDQLRAISGKKRNATRKEVRAWVEDMVMTLDPNRPELPREVVVSPLKEARAQASDALTVLRRAAADDCGPIDHIYPAGPPVRGVSCYCGKRSWGPKEN